MALYQKPYIIIIIIKIHVVITPPPPSVYDSSVHNAGKAKPSTQRG